MKPDSVELPGIRVSVEARHVEGDNDRDMILQMVSIDLGRAVENAGEGGAIYCVFVTAAVPEGELSGAIFNCSMNLMPESGIAMMQRAILGVSQAHGIGEDGEGPVVQ